MPPDFTQKTIEILSKRAGGRCSNPDCRVLTIGPNSNPEKHTTIGEAAHIAGAKPNSARYKTGMTDVARAMITNAIWLCGNCHTRVDRDPVEFSEELLLAWRADHEQFVMEEFGTRSEAIKYNSVKKSLEPFLEYPLSVQRIVEDRPDGWEFVLTSALLRHLNAAHFKRLKHLRLGLLSKARPRIKDEEVFHWLSEKIATMAEIAPPFVNCIEMLNKSWGKPGEAGDAEEIRDVCLLIEENLRGVVQHEEDVRFANLPNEADEVKQLLTDAVGHAIQCLENVPQTLDEMLEIAMSSEADAHPLLVERQMLIELPDGWENKIDRALKRLERNLLL